MEGLCDWQIGEHRVQLVVLERMREILKIGRPGEPPRASSVTLVVHDAQAAGGQATTLRGTAVSHFENTRFQTASVADPEGNLVTFLQVGSRPEL